MKTSACSLVLLAAGLPAQSGSFIVPSKLADGVSPTATTRGDTFETYMFWTGQNAQPVRIQHFFETADIPVAATTLRGMNFRRNNYVNQQNPAATATLSLQLSVGPNTLTTVSTTFAGNLGNDLMTVFSGQINLPPDFMVPAPAPFLAQVPFTTPFPYVGSRGPTLVADYTITQYTPAGPIWHWRLDALSQDQGTFLSNGSDQCRFSNGRTINQFRYTVPNLGGNWSVEYSNYQGGLPPGLPGLGLLGLRGSGSFWGFIRLPFSLYNLGAPSCFLAVSTEVVVILNEGPSGVFTFPSLTVPTDPSLNGATFFEQGMWFDPQANALGIVMGASGRWMIRTGNFPRGAKVFQWSISGTPYPGPGLGLIENIATIAQFVY